MNLVAGKEAGDPATLGTVVRSHQARAFRVTVAEHARGCELPEHAHETAGAVFVTGGCYAERVGGDDREHGPGTFLFKPAGVEHSNRFRSSGSRCLLVEFAAGDDSPLLLSTRPFAEAFALADEELSDLGLRLLAALDGRDDPGDLSLQCWAIELFARAEELLRGSGLVDEPAVVRRARELVHATYREELTLADLARRVGVHPVYLARVFRRVTGSTLGELRRRLRVAHVRAGLRDPERSLADLALEAGFSDQSHCTRVFRAVLGTTPGVLRREGPSRPWRGPRDGPPSRR